MRVRNPALRRLTNPRGDAGDPSLRDPEAGGTLAEHLAGWEGRRLRLPERSEPDGEAVRWHRGMVFGA